MEKICLLDLEGTLIDNEFFVEMASLNGSKDEVQLLTEKAMSGAISFDDAMQKRAELVRGLDLKKVRELIKNTRLKTGADELISTLTALGYKINIVTGGFSLFADEIAKKIGIEKVYANNLVFNKNMLMSVTNTVKKNEIAKTFSDSGHTVISIGDGANDFGMFKYSSASFLVGAREDIAKNADFHFNNLEEIATAIKKPFFLVSNEVKMPEVEANILRFSNDEELEAKISLASVLIVRSQNIGAKLIDKAPNLKLIIRQGIGIDNIDSLYANEKSIAVVNTPLSAPSVTELTLGFMIMASRDLPARTNEMNNNIWKGRENVVGNELFGKTLGIIGLGRIGTQVARVAHALGMKVIYYDPYVEETMFEKKFFLANLLPKADLISLHVPLNAETHEMINLDNIGLIKKDAILINTCRGSVIQFDALKKAIENNLIKYACLDVHYQEPPEYGLLLKTGKLILTPHIGGSTVEARQRMEQRVGDILLQNGFG
ncbi:MAG: HAD-IB family phosphatase [archaeon]|nr:HAD-IB family phosphatase [archaeon]